MLPGLEELSYVEAFATVFSAKDKEQLSLVVCSFHQHHICNLTLIPCFPPSFPWIFSLKELDVVSLWEHTHTHTHTAVSLETRAEAPRAWCHRLHLTVPAVLARERAEQ